MKDAAEPKAGATGTQISAILFFKNYINILSHFMASVLTDKSLLSWLLFSPSF